MTTITLENLAEIARLLEEHPEWKQVFRTLLLTEELLALPEQFGRLVTIVEEMARTFSAQIAELRGEIAELRAGQEELRAGQEELRAGQEELRAGQERMERKFSAEIAELRARQERFEQTVSAQFAELRSQIGSIANAYGLTLEGEAEDATQYLARQKGWELVSPLQSLDLNGEIDIVALCKDSEGNPFTLLVEVKARLAQRTVREWANRVRSEGFRQKLEQEGFPPPYRMYLMGFRINPPVEEEARLLGVGLLTGRGERVEPVLIQ